MAEFKKMIVTNKGQSLITKMLAGETNIKFTKISLSESNYMDNEIMSLTALTGIKQTSNILKVVRTSNTTVQVEGYVDNKSLKNGYYIKTIGIYAQDPKEGEILYAVCNASVPGWMAPYNGISTSSTFIRLITTVQNSSKVEIQINPTGTATVRDVKNLESELGNLRNMMNDKVLELTLLISETHDQMFPDLENEIREINKSLTSYQRTITDSPLVIGKNKLGIGKTPKENYFDISMETNFDKMPKVSGSPIIETVTAGGAIGIKYADGTLICYGSLFNSNTWGYQTINFPVHFTSSPYVYVQLGQGSSAFYSFHNWNNSNNTRAQIVLYGSNAVPLPEGSAVQFSWLSFGRWK